jgi:drug/metabolite transporter (DMT)-like permease
MWMAGWLLQMLVIAIAGREALRELNVFQVMEFRSAIGFVLLLPLVYRAGGFKRLRTHRPLQHVARNLVHYGAQFGWFFALTLIPLGEVVAIEFTTPIWTAILATAFLGEHMNRGRILAVVFGLAGVIVIVRPGLTGANAGQIVAMLAAVAFGVSIVMVKSLTRTDTTLQIIFWMTVVQSTAGLIPAIVVWSWPSATAWGWLLVVAFCGTFSHYCMARAMLYADATIVVPMDFLRVPLTALAGWLIYAERMDLLTVMGAAMILGGNLLNLRSPAEQRAAA